jgi:hypothetical protein
VTHSNTTSVTLKEPSSTSTSSGLPTWGWVLIALGVVALSGAGVLYHRRTRAVQERAAAGTVPPAPPSPGGPGDAVAPGPQSERLPPSP